MFYSYFLLRLYRPKISRLGENCESRSPARWDRQTSRVPIRADLRWNFAFPLGALLRGRTGISLRRVSYGRIDNSHNRAALEASPGVPLGAEDGRHRSGGYSLSHGPDGNVSRGAISVGQSGHPASQG